MSEQATQFVAGYWVDILLLAGLAIIACAFTALCIIDRARKKRGAAKKKPGTQRRELFCFMLHCKSFWHGQFRSVWRVGLWGLRAEFRVSCTANHGLFYNCRADTCL